MEPSFEKQYAYVMLGERVLFTASNDLEAMRKVKEKFGPHLPLVTTIYELYPTGEVRSVWRPYHPTETEEDFY